MLRVRHGFAVGLSIVFISLFIGSMLLLRVNATLLSSDFINDQLRQADFFTFLYDDVAPLAVEEQIQAIGRPTLRRPSWTPRPYDRERQGYLSSRVAPSQRGATPSARYCPTSAAVRTTLRFAIPVKERLLGSTDAIKVLARSSGVYEITASQAFEDKADQALEEFGQLPLGVTLQDDDLAWTAQQIAPPDWLEGQLEGALDEVLAYLTHESD